MALNNCFCKTLTESCSFAFICYIFAAQLPIVPIKDPPIFYGLYINLETSFNCYLMSVLTLNIFLLRKCRLIFEFCRYFIIFFSTSGTVSVKTGRDQFLVDHKLILLTVYVELLVSLF